MTVKKVAQPKSKSKQTTSQSTSTRQASSQEKSVPKALAPSRTKKTVTAATRSLFGDPKTTQKRAKKESKNKSKDDAVKKTKNVLKPKRKIITEKLQLEVTKKKLTTAVGLLNDDGLEAVKDESDEETSDRKKKESITHMASLLDEAVIPPVEKRSGLFEEIKDSPINHKNVGGRSVFKHRDSLNLYKKGYEPGHSLLIHKNRNRRNPGFHLSLNLNESTASFLGSSVGFLEMSSGLVVNNTKPKHGFHISLDESSIISQSGIFIKNQIFDQNNEWVTAQTTPGRMEKPQINLSQSQNEQCVSNADKMNFQNMENNLIVSRNDDQAVSNTSTRRNSTRMSFLFNQHIGFICKHCFSSSCHHMDNISPFASPHRITAKQDNDEVKITEIESSEQTKIFLRQNNFDDENNEEKPLSNDQISNSNDETSGSSDPLDEAERDSESDADSMIKEVENLKNQLVEKLQDVLDLSDLMKLIKLREVYHADKNGNFIPYHEVVIEVDDGIDSELSFRDDIENELLAVGVNDTTDELTRQDVEHTSSAVKELELSGNDLRYTPVIEQKQVPVMIKSAPISRQTSCESKETLYYDSDYDDASYLNGCNDSKTHSFERLDLTNDIIFSNVEYSSENKISKMPTTPPLTSSSPTNTPENTLRVVRRKTSLRPLSDLETVFETDEVHTATTAMSIQSNALTNVTADDTGGLDELLEMANTILEQMTSNDIPQVKEAAPVEKFKSLADEIQNDKVEKANEHIKVNNDKKEVTPVLQNNSVTYADLSVSELKALSKKHVTLRSLAELEESRYDAGKRPEQPYSDILDEIREHYHNLNPEDELQLWLQEVRKRSLNAEYFDHENEEFLLPEDEEVCKINIPESQKNSASVKAEHENNNLEPNIFADTDDNHINNDNVTYNSSNQYHSEGLSTNLNASYKHIDVLVIDNNEASRQQIQSPQNSDIHLFDDISITSVPDSGVESHMTEGSQTIATGQQSLSAQALLSPRVNTSNITCEDKIYAQRLAFTYDLARDYRDLNIQNLISRPHRFSYFDHIDNITEPMSDYHTHMAAYNRYINASMPILNNVSHQPKPPSFTKETKREFRRNFVLSSSAHSSPTDSYVDSLKRISPRSESFVPHPPPHQKQPRMYTRVQPNIFFSRPYREDLPPPPFNRYELLPHIYQHKNLVNRTVHPRRTSVGPPPLRKTTDEKHEATPYLTFPCLSIRSRHQRIVAGTERFAVPGNINRFM